MSFRTRNSWVVPPMAAVPDFGTTVQEAFAETGNAYAKGELNKKLADGWRVVHGTFCAEYKNVNSASVNHVLHIACILEKTVPNKKASNQ